MGAVDLVIQVESPKSSRAACSASAVPGHPRRVEGPHLPEVPRPTSLECAVVASGMREGAIEETRIPRNPLDVLAQQIVAICADEESRWTSCTSSPGRVPVPDSRAAQLENTLDMLAGRYPSEEFAELRPRIVWDRVGGVVKGRGGRPAACRHERRDDSRPGPLRRLPVDGGGRVGELDEEMVYEARAGQTFMLGATTWRIEEITRDRVLVSPAPGIPGAVPFWKGEGAAARTSSARRSAAWARVVALQGREGRRAPEREHRLDRRAAANLLTYLREQEEATGAVPSDRAIVVERFRDEIGDWRVCILTPFGGRVHAPWALALGTPLRESLGLEVNAIWSDDGIALHLPDADAPPPIDDLLLPRTSRGTGRPELGGRRSSALASARTRRGHC